MDKNNINNLDYVHKYVQGSVWKWIKKESLADISGGLPNEKLVLIISNDTFNTYSPNVNCIFISSILKESPVHVPVYISADSHIQCEQISTAPKSELTDFKGIIPPSVLSAVKAKIRIQFNMSEDKNTELLSVIKKNTDELKAKVAEGFGIPELESEYVKFLSNINNSYEEIKSDIAAIKSIIDNTGDEIRTRGKSSQRKYTREDKKFIADASNSIDKLVERYGYSKPYAYKMRNYFQKRLKINTNEPKISKLTDNEYDEYDDFTDGSQTEQKIEKHRKHMKYSEEDIRFITDTKNSIRSIIEKYGFDGNKAAYRTRNYLKRTYQKNKN